jgi:hypothetical protein
MIELLQAHLRGEHRGEARNECPACARADGPDPTAEGPREPRKRPQREQGTRPCECGCGAEVRSRFLPGHDAKLKSRLLREARSSDPILRLPAKLDLERRGWLKFL